MIVIACPGQGSQTPGFLSPWLEDASNRDWLTRVSDRIGTDLLLHGTVSNADTIRQTVIAQPLIVAAGILTINALQQELDAAAKQSAAHADAVSQLKQRLAFAGHSVGEITAAYGAQVFTADTAMDFVAARAAAMQKCAAAHYTTMAAVLGADVEQLVIHLTELGISPANYNGAGQVVVGGDTSSVAELVANPPTGSRVIQLQVAGAFHTEYMRPAQAELAQQLAAYPVATPASVLFTNRDGSCVTDGATYLELLVGQVASPVRWDLCMQSMATANVQQLVEVAPSGALAGLARRALPGAKTHKITAPQDVQQLVTQLVAQQLAPKYSA